jgi:hypothetical protein
VVGAVLLLVLALALLLQTGPVASRVSAYVVPRASEALGREVTVREAKLRLFPRPRVALAGAAVAGRPGEPPLVELQAIEVTLEPWPLVTSLRGSHRRDTSVKPVVNLARARRDLEHRGLGEVEAASGSAAPEPEPRARTIAVAHAAIEGGAIPARESPPRPGGGGHLHAFWPSTWPGQLHRRAVCVAGTRGTSRPTSTRRGCPRARPSWGRDWPRSPARSTGSTWRSCDVPAAERPRHAEQRTVDAAAVQSTRQEMPGRRPRADLPARLRGEPGRGGFELHASPTQRAAGARRHRSLAWIQRRARRPDAADPATSRPLRSGRSWT